jgi:hypothetical protein
MERISAAEQMLIEMSDTGWRLISNGSQEPRVIFEAASGRALHYLPDFATTRRLPKGGSLPVEYIQRIVLGWSASDESWHLGLMLASELAQARGSRWCEIARWPDPHTTTFSEIAGRAGRNLAQVTTRPFSLVPPQPVEAQPERTLTELPISLGDDWTLERDEGGSLQLVYNRRWARVALRRVVWYSLWTAVYLLLVYLTLTSNIAPPTPVFLPYLGIFSALILIALVFKNLLRLLRQVTHVVMDEQRREIHGMHGRRILWSLDQHEIRSVYASQVIGRRRGRAAAPQYGEINLLLANNKFRFLLGCEEINEQEMEDDGAGDGVFRLSNENYNTDLQAAGLYIAQALDVPAWYDRRPQ